MESSRSAAIDKGEMHYHTGKPCPYGHIDVRYAKTGQCKSCVRESSKKNWVNKTGKTRVRWTTATIVPEFTKLHGGRYTYEHVIYTRHKDKVLVTCPPHGDFMITPDNHMQGKGCPICEKHRRLYVFGGCNRGTTNQFVQAAVLLWGDQFDYSEVEYIGSHQGVVIICKEHGPFIQTPTNHLSRKLGCSKCNHMKSAPEQELSEWLSGIGIKVIQRSRDIIPPKEIDIYLPEHKIAIEYCGLYWHSHFNAEDEAKGKHKHKEKYDLCAEQGIRLITLYENEWTERKAVIKRLLRAATGKLRGRVMARKCVVGTPTSAEASAFYDKYHPQGGDGGGVYYGLYWKTKLVACMRFAEGINDRGAAAKTKEWTLSRYATRVGVSGGASRLFKAFMEEHGYPKVKSFSDNRLFSGGMYESLGFKLEGESAPDYQVWSPKVGLKPKSHYQRRTIPKRLAEHEIQDSFDPKSDPRTEKDMTYLMKCGRIYDCGKKRWVYNSSVDS